MALTPRWEDDVDRQRRLRSDTQRERVARPFTHVENFILDPITERMFPPALAIRQRIIGVLLYHTSADPITVDMVVEREDPPVDEPNPWVLKNDPTDPLELNTFTAAGAGVVHYKEVGVDLEIGDIYYPEIVAGDGGEITASFIVAP